MAGMLSRRACPLISMRTTERKPRAIHVARTSPHIQLSSPRRRGSSIPDTAMIEPISRGVLDPSLAVEDDSGGCGDVSRVIASYPVGAKRRRMTGSAKQSIYPPNRDVDCFAALAISSGGKDRSV